MVRARIWPWKKTEPADDDRMDLLQRNQELLKDLIETKKALLLCQNPPTDVPINNEEEDDEEDIFQDAEDGIVPKADVHPDPTMMKLSTQLDRMGAKASGMMKMQPTQDIASVAEELAVLRRDVSIAHGTRESWLAIPGSQRTLLAEKLNDAVGHLGAKLDAIYMSLFAAARVFVRVRDGIAPDVDFACDDRTVRYGPKHYSFAAVVSNTNNDALGRELSADFGQGAIDHVLGGGHLVVMGVGGSGSGKTHSLFGNPNEPGILFSTLDAIKKAIPGVLFDTEELTDFYAYMKPESLGHLMDTSGKGPISVLKPEIADAIQLPGCLSRDQVFSESVVQFGYDHLRGKHVLTPDIAKVASKPVQRRELSLTVPLLFDPALEPLRTLTRTTATSLIDSLNGGNGVVAFEHFQTARERCGFAKPTPNNPHSSRSSLFWTISVVSTHSNHTLGRITVIDAAGSENPTDIINSYLQSVRPLDRFPGDLRVLAGNPAASQIVLEGVMINETVAHTKRLLWKQSPIAEVRREADRAFWKGYRQQLIGGLRDKRGIRTGYQPSWALFWDSGRILSVSRLAEIFAGSRVKINLLGCIAPSRSKRAQTFNTLDFCNSVQTGAVEAFSTTTHVSRCVGSRCGHPGVVERFIHAVFFG